MSWIWGSSTKKVPASCIAIDLSTIAATPPAYASDLLIGPPSIEASMFGKPGRNPVLKLPYTVNILSFKFFLHFLLDFVIFIVWY